MWVCKNCGSSNGVTVRDCVRCGISAERTRPRSDEEVGCRIFRGSRASWRALFDEAARFASEVGRERLVNISHSADAGDAVVAVWYWE